MEKDKFEGHHLPFTKGLDIAVGDVVILKDHHTKRVFWKLAVVEQLLTGNDEKVWANLVKTTDAQGEPKLLMIVIQLKTHQLIHLLSKSQLWKIHPEPTQILFTLNICNHWGTAVQGKQT